MFFKSLEIQGFKSFADKTVLHFDNKMTAVVGSNGNGKSNISDALRWVMGEQGAKSLRGDKMEDVIFHGTVSRKSMSFAKVSLTIDNTDRVLKYDDDEIIITRKLYRTGDSEYLINNEKTRLKDIQEMLLGTGLGRDGYSIIGQGRVAEIVNAKETQRREIFEEAAGVSKFLHRKAEAERELARSEDNILRLKDIIISLEERIPALEKQSEKAQRAKILLEEEKKLEISVSVSELDQLHKNMSEIENAILVNEGECEHFEREILNLEREAREISDKKIKNTAEIDKLRNLGDTAKDEIAFLDREIAVLQNEISHNEKGINNINEQLLNSEKSSVEFDEKIDDLTFQTENKNKEIEATKNNIKLKNEELKKADEQNLEHDTRFKELNDRLNRLFAAKNEAEFKIKQADINTEEITTQLYEMSKKTDSQSELIGAYQNQKKMLKAKLSKLVSEKEETENKLSGYTKLLSSKEEKYNKAKENFDDVRKSYEQKKSRLDILSDVEKNMAGYYSSVKSIISASKSEKLSRINGTVADIITVPQKYSLAVEIALGSALQHVIVENEETAKRCIRYLKENGAGRATFLPLTSIKGNIIDSNGINSEDGFEGIAASIVEFDEKYRNIVNSLLGKTVIVDDIDSATFIAKKYGYKFKIITLDGQVINAGGSFTGGSVNKESTGIISRKHEINALTNEVKSLCEKITVNKTEFLSLEAEVKKMNLELSGFKDTLQAANLEETKLTAEINGVENLIEQSENQAETSKNIVKRYKEQLASQAEFVVEFTANLNSANSEIEKNNLLLAEAGENIETASIEKSKINEEISQLNMLVLTYEKDIESIKIQLENVVFSKNSLGESKENLAAEIEKINKNTEDLNNEILVKNQRIEEINLSFKEHQSKISELVEIGTSLEKRVSLLSHEIREKSSDKEKFWGALVVAKERKTSTESELEKLAISLWDKYELTPTEAKKLAEIISDIRESKNKLNDIRKKISALGSVNFAAIDEFIEVSEKYKDLSDKLSDVLKAKTDLENLITNLTADIKARFLSSFNDINEHFKVVFKEIFGGGNAELKLTDEEDILNTGIEILAAPPGKVIKNLISLSGGEQTMVAITIYFAILLHRPTPFCMLDEVDAALDDINVVKYVTYLKRFSAKTQLMIITHRRGTIEGCDILYGVFMQEKGVSRLLRQEITDDLELT